MSQMAVESYQLSPKSEQVKPQTYFRFSGEQSKGKEITTEILKTQIPYNRILKNVNLEPVYVDKMTNELIYNSRIMEKWKPYYVEWGDESFMLVREDNNVNIYRFEGVD